MTDRHVSGSFHSPPGLLFSFPSKYWFAIGLREYLGLRGLRSRVGPEIPVRPTLFDGSTNPAFAYGAVTLFGELFQAASAIQGKALRRHMSDPFPDPIRLGLFPFHSPLLRKSLLLSFPPGTMMLRLPGFTLRFGWSVRSFRKTPEGIPRSELTTEAFPEYAG